MRALPIAAGLWYAFVGALLGLGGDGAFSLVAGVLFTAEGAVIAVHGARAWRGDARARLAVRWGCWTVLAVVGAAVAVWGYQVVSDDAYPLVGIAVGDGTLLQVAAVTVPAAVTLLVVRRVA